MVEAADANKRAKQLGRLWWLVDAPLFIDHNLVERLHDAVVWPEHKDEIEQKAKFEKIRAEGSLSAEAEGGAEWSLPKFLDWISPKFKANAKIAMQGALEGERSTSTTSTGQVVDNSERKLNELVLEYLADFPERIVFVDVPGGAYSNYKGKLERAEAEKMLESPPRPLVFMDIQPRSPIFPTMIEMEEGGFRPLYEKLDQKLLGHLNPAPRYDDDPAKRKDYWAAVEKGFKSRAAMVEVETACGEGRIGWIDFRLLFKEGGETAHLHIVPAGRYHAGVFGYNFIHRGHKYGCRIVGSLKSGNDVNVLAIYER